MATPAIAPELSTADDPEFEEDGDDSSAAVIVVEELLVVEDAVDKHEELELAVDITINLPVVALSLALSTITPWSDVPPETLTRSCHDFPVRPGKMAIGAALG